SNVPKKNKKRKHLPREIGRQIAVVAILSMLLVTSIVYFISRQIIYNETLGRITETASTAANSVETFMEKQETLLSAAASASVFVNDKNKLPDLYLGMMQNHAEVQELYMGFADGTGVFGKYDSPVPEGWNATESDWYKLAARAGGSIVVTEPYPTTAGLGMCITLVAQAGEVGGIQGTIGIDVGIDVIVSIINSIKLGENGYAFLVTNNGAIVTHKDTAFVPAGDKIVNISSIEAYAGITDIVQGGSVPVKRKDYDGIEKYFAAVNIPDANWTLYVVLPVYEITKDLNIGLAITIAPLVVMAFITGLFTVIVIRRKITYSLTRLLKGLNGLSVGDVSFRARKGNHDDEISLLYDGFGKISTIIRELIEDMGVMATEHAHGNYTYKIDVSKYTGAYAKIINGINEMTFTYTDDFIAVIEMLEKFAEGDFTADVRQYPGELSASNVTIDKVRNNLAGISNEIKKIADRAARGDLTVRANESNAKGEWLQILSGLNMLVDEVAKPVTEVSAALKKFAAGDLSAKVTGDYSGSFNLMKQSLNSTIKEIAGIILTISATLKAVEGKDMTVRINKAFKGDFNEIKLSVNNIINNQSQLLKYIAEASNRVSIDAKEIESANSVLAKGVSVQAEKTESISSAFATVSEQTTENAENAERADKISKTSLNNANEGNEKMQSMLLAMEEIMTASDSIATIIKTIRDIAFQTNMLALNASVEAARAGAQGKGFNVVADEVRNLAMRRSKASKETHELINDIVSKIKEGTGFATAASAALTTIVSDVNSASRMVTKIAKCSLEQKKVVDLAAYDMEQISNVVHSNSATSEQTAAAATELSLQATRLDDVLRQFKI
ncbi:MAG: methyl-accepting chemotaxis protein, partial [Clostridiales bacterium]|nr:methyl-accepting chemotaxis protein [Clostridiales bacterium]